jgi:inner membrane protein
MDPVTHALFGAVSTRFLLSIKTKRAAWVIAGISAITPDLDLLIPCSGSPMEKASLHRYYTHALTVFPFEALLLMWLFKKLYKENLKSLYVYMLALFGLCSHVFLDVLTSSGLPFLWPFTRYRFSLEVLPIIDPCFSSFLLIAFIGIWRNKRFLGILGTCLALTYGFLAEVQHERAAHQQYELCAQRGHVAERTYVMPSFGNILLWRSIYEYQGHYYVDGVRLGVTTTVYPGDCFVKASLEDFFAYRGTTFYKECALFFWMMRGCVAISSDGGLSGLCHSLLPHTSDLVSTIYIAKEKPSDVTPKIYPKPKTEWRARLQRDGLTFLHLLIGR